MNDQEAANILEIIELIKARHKFSGQTPSVENVVQVLCYLVADLMEEIEQIKKQLENHYD